MLVSLNSNLVIKAPALTIDYREIHSVISALFPGRKPVLVQRVLNGRNYTWNIPISTGETWRQLGQANEQERSIVLNELNSYRSLVEERIQLDQDTLNAIFTTPDSERFIFFCITDGKCEIALAGWGLIYKSVSIDRSSALVVINDGNLLTKSNVTVGFAHKGELLSSIKFRLILPSGTTRNFRTSSDGKCDLGELPSGITFTIEALDFNQSFSLSVETGKKLYLFEIVIPENKNNTPKRNPTPAKHPESGSKVPPQDGDNGKKVKKAPKPFNPDPNKVIFDPERKCKIYSDCIFAIVDSSASTASNPIEELVRQVNIHFPSVKLVSKDDFCDMMLFAVPDTEREKILRELPQKIKNVSFYADVISVFAETENHSQDTKSENWHVNAVNAGSAHRYTTGSKSVRIAVIDSYFDLKHPAFNHLNVESALSLENGTDNVLPPGESSEYQHGTHVLGLISAKTPFYQGIAPDCTVLPISLGKQINSISILQAVIYALKCGATVINLSLGMDIPEETTKRLSIDEQIRWWQNKSTGYESVWDYVYGMLDRGFCTAVWSSGNDNIFELMEPNKRHDHIIRVDAVDQNLLKAPFSNFGNISRHDGRGKRIDKSVISAPGVEIFSTVPGGKWDYMSGTSMAAPIVCGAVALIKSIDATLVNSDIIRILKETSLPIIDKEIGSLLQIDKALDKVSNNISFWNEFRTKPDADLGIWKNIDQATYVDSKTLEFEYYGQNYVIFKTPLNGIFEVHRIGMDCVYSAEFNAHWSNDEVILDIIGEVSSQATGGIILTKQLRLFRDTDGSVGFEVMLPERTGKSKLRKLTKDDRYSKK